jgi:hypothetical protein
MVGLARQLALLKLSPAFAFNKSETHRLGRRKRGALRWPAAMNSNGESILAWRGGFCISRPALRL